MQTRGSTPTRRIIIDAAVRLICEKGTAQFTLDEVARKAGISKGGLLHHFKGKEELILGVVASIMENFMANVQKRVEGDPDEKGRWSRSYLLETIRNTREEKDLNLALLASVSTNKKVLTIIQESYQSLERHISEDGIDPVQSVMIRLIADGIWYSELFGVNPILKSDKKDKVLDQLLQLTKGEEI